MSFSRRRFLASSAAAAAATALSPQIALGADKADAGRKAKYRRHNVASPEGQRMLASYARGIKAMLALPADDPLNWFRNAFTHFLDCPHGNWWFFVWHRGFVGHFEATIRRLSGDADLAMPYWDWTTQPEIPASMFDGVLTPTDHAYEPYTGNLAQFTAFAKPAMTAYWATLSTAQRGQLDARGYKAFDDVWNDVTGYSVAQDAGISGNAAFVNTCGARYLSRSNPKLDAKTAYNVSEPVICAGLAPTQFYDTDVARSFTSSRTASHLMQPNGATKFCILEGFPHNKVHNYIGGVGPLDPGPYGNMTNFLSPVDPIFFLHHANMDRLWDVWTKKQIAHKLPFVPDQADFDAFMNEPFLFFVGADGKPVGPTKAADCFTMSAFDYDYAPGSGNDCIVEKPALRAGAQAPAFAAKIAGDTASADVPNEVIKRQLAGKRPHPLIAEVTLERPSGLSTAREFDVLVNAPADVGSVESDSPYYAGTLAFFGATMPNMAMSHQATFAVPLPRGLQAFSALKAEKTRLDIRLVPANAKHAHAPPVQEAVVVPAS